MTIILALGNSDQIVQVCDRRLSYDGKLVEDEANKGGILVCSNARLAYGFTGLAKCGGFDTQRWLVQNLTNLGPPDFTAKSLLDRLKERATENFASIDDLVKARAEVKRLTIMFSGYLYHHSPPLAGFAVLSNFQDFDTMCDSEQARDSFKSWFWSQETSRSEDFTFVQCVGFLQATKAADGIALEKLLKQRKPARAIIKKAVEIIRQMAERPEAHGTIGKQLLSITLPRELGCQPISEYHSMAPKPTIFLSPVTVATKRMSASVELQLTIVDENKNPVPIIAKVGRNKRCPCGSGKKYKMCHGISPNKAGLIVSDSGIQTKIISSDPELDQISQNAADLLRSYKMDIGEGKTNIKLNVHSLRAFIETAPEVRYWIVFLQENTGQRVESWGDLSRDVRIAERCGISTLDEIRKVMIDAVGWGEQFFKMYYDEFFKESGIKPASVTTVLNGVVTWLLIASNEHKFSNRVLESEFGIHGLGSWYIVEAARQAKEIANK